MKHIGADPAVVTADEYDFDREPTDAELDAIDREMPLIVARVDLLDARIICMSRVPNEMDTRRLRRARRRVLAARRALANQSAVLVSGVGA